MEIQGEHLGELVRRMRAAGVEPLHGLGTADGKGVYTFNAKGTKTVALSAEAQAVVDTFEAEGPSPDPRIAKVDGMDVSDRDKATIKELLGI